MVSLPVKTIRSNLCLQTRGEQASKSAIVAHSPLRRLHKRMESRPPTPANTLMRQALAHGGIALALSASLVTANSWAQAVNDDIVRYAAATWAFLCGLVFSHIIHEWCHYGGARLARSSLRLKPRIHPLFFDFDLQANTARQFLWLSLGGLAGNFLLLALLVAYHTNGNIVTTGLLAAVLGQLVFVVMLELPVSLEVMTGKNPLAALTAHFGQGGPLFLRAAMGGAGTAVMVFLLY